jgi:hypothetical protein
MGATSRLRRIAIGKLIARDVPVTAGTRTVGQQERAPSCNTSHLREVEAEKREDRTRVYPSSVASKPGETVLLRRA